MLFNIKKKKLFLIIISLLSIYSSFNLCVYSRDQLSPITNGTGWTLAFTYNWKGCGFEGNHGNKDGKHHFDKVFIASGGTQYFTRGCIASNTNVYITPISKNGTALASLKLTVNRPDNKISMNSAGQNISGAYSAILKYDPKHTTGEQGYYWVTN